MLSVVVPARREGARLLSTIDALLQRPSVGEVVAAAHGEAGSVRRRAEYRRRLTWVPCPRACRGEQLNLGAQRARGDTLLFLHADTMLPEGAEAAIEVALRDPRVLGGAFRLRFDARHPALRLVSHLSPLPWRLAYFGDQGFFCRRAAFEAAGGFAPFPLLEDVDLARRIARRGRLVRLPLSVTTSARRFLARGPWRQVGLDAALLALYYLGVGPHRLARVYGP